MEKKIYKKNLIGYKEYKIEHKNDKNQVLYIEHIKEPIYKKVENIVQISQKEIASEKIEILKKWFDEIYRCQIEQATRAQILQQNYSYQDNIRNKTYTCLMDLYQEANVVQTEIRNLQNSY